MKIFKEKEERFILKEKAKSNQREKLAIFNNDYRNTDPSPIQTLKVASDHFQFKIIVAKRVEKGVKI